MKTTRLVSSLLVAAVVTAFAVSANASDSKRAKDVQAQNANAREHVVLVQVTGSLIPQRVVISGNAVNAASPVVFYGRNDLYRSGADNIGLALARIDPDISTRGAGR